MKKILLSALASLVLFVVLSSCDSNYSEIESTVTSEHPLSKIEDLSSARRKGGIPHQLKFLGGHGCKKWQVTTYLINDEDYTTTLFGECSLDNIQIFSLNGDYLEIEGATKCNESDPTIYDSGTFQFSNDYTTWTLASSHLNTSFDVLELTPVSFKITYVDPAFGKIEIWLEAYRPGRPHHNHSHHQSKPKQHFKNYRSPFFTR